MRYKIFLIWVKWQYDSFLKRTRPWLPLWGSCRACEAEGVSFRPGEQGVRNRNLLPSNGRHPTRPRFSRPPSPEGRARGAALIRLILLSLISRYGQNLFSNVEEISRKDLQFFWEYGNMKTFKERGFSLISLPGAADGDSIRHRKLLFQFHTKKESRYALRFF